jgi:hypothetical protein
MRRGFPLLAFFSATLAWSACVRPSLAQQPSPTFELRGVVVNSVTGKPVAGALVQLFAFTQLTQFSGSDGTFVFTGIARGRFPLTARKPGFFNEQELGSPWQGPGLVAVVPSEKEAVVKLMPEAIIYGRVTSENNQPLEGIIVRAQRWQIVDGYRELEFVTLATTDDQGNYRFAGLKPGTYFLRFKSVNVLHPYAALGTEKAGPEDYGSEFYPGVPDLTSATPIPIGFGSHVDIDQILTKQATFQISGTVVGANLAANGVNLTVMDNEGDAVPKMVRFDRNTGRFQIAGVPAGTYLLSATALGFSGAGTPPQQSELHAYLPISITSDLSGVSLMLRPGISIPVRIDDETSQDAPGNARQVYLRMNSRFSRNFSQAIIFSRAPNGQISPAAVNGLVPGTYDVAASVFGPGYVAELRCGDVNLLRRDLKVGPSGALPPIDVTLRDGGGQLSGTVTENGQPAPAGVVIYSEDYPKRSQLVQTDESGRFSASNLAPGTYQVLAVKNPQDLEYRNPAIMQEYAGRGAEVTLTPYGKATIRLELPPADEGQP